MKDYVERWTWKKQYYDALNITRSMSSEWQGTSYYAAAPLLDLMMAAQVL